MEFDSPEALALRVAARWQRQSDTEETAGRFTFPREFHLPKEVRDTPPNVDSQGTDLAIWEYEANGVLYAIGFAGKQSKPLFHNRFNGAPHRTKVIQEYIDGRKSRMEYTQKRQQERKDYQHSFVKGDILYTSWGYDQTNIDFYEVVDVKGAVLVVREIGEKLERDDGKGTEYVVPQPGHFVGSPMRVRPTPNGVKIENHSGSKWDGKPKYQTALGWGH
jgi:hypothetical protein